MAIGFIASTESHTGTSGSSNQASFSFSVAGGATIQGALVFVMNLDSATNNTTSVTYGGVNMTLSTNGVAADTAGEVGRCSAWYLDAPPTGTQTVVVNRNNNAQVMYAVGIAISATAGKLTEIYEPGVVLLQADGTIAPQYVTGGTPAAASMCFAGGMFGHQTLPSAGASSTLLQSMDIGAQGAVVVRETTAGTGSRAVGMSSGTSDDRAVVHLAIRENGNRPTNDPGTTRDVRISGQIASSLATDVRIIGQSLTSVARISLASTGTPSSRTQHSIKVRARIQSGTGKL